MTTPHGRRTQFAALLVMASSVSTQAGSALATRLFTLVSPAGATALRLLGAAAVLAAVAGPRAMRAVPRSALPVVAGLGLSSAAMNLAFYEAISRIPLGAAVTLEFLGPIAVAGLGSRRARDLALAGLALAGVALVSGGLESGAGAVGAVFALAAGAMWGVYLLFARRMGADGSGMGGLALAVFVGAIATAPLLLVAHPHAADLPRALALGVAVGSLSNALTYALEIAALRRTTITVVGVLLALDPVVAAVIGLVALGQALGAVQWAGMALVVFAGAAVVRGAAPAAAAPQP